MLHPAIDPPLLTPEHPGVGGRIRVQSEDFEVEEVPSYEPCGTGDHLYLWVEKRDVGYYTRRLLDTFKQQHEVRFSELFHRTEGRYGLIGTLIALLEMMKQGYLRASQENCFDEIHLSFSADGEVTVDMVLAGITAEEERQRAQEAAAAAAAASPAVAAGDAPPA